MTFVEAFYSFNIELVDVEHDVYEQLRLKTPKHPYETFEHLYARMLAFVHHYQKGQTFTRGVFESAEPAIWSKDVIGEVELWVEAGAPDRKKLLRALQQHEKASFRVYFYQTGEAAQFCHAMRGKKNNWLRDVSYYQIDPALLESLIPLTTTSARWRVTVLEDVLYIVINDAEFQTTIERVDIEELYHLELQKGE